ncbi:MAG: TSUP family transporter [Elusimicrobia bacterium]|nr:TSUP family transporter [Elusimicrobiota bacterium]
MTLLLLAGFIAGFVDSIIGGGGLITVPALMLHLGISPHSIGTNKIAGACATLTAMAVYGFKKQVPWVTALQFAGWTGVGAILGAYFSPRFLAPIYPLLLWMGTGFCLATLLFRNRILSSSRERTVHKSDLSTLAAALGFICGLYDGAWGPGGGTFMFLVLFYVTPLGLLGSMAAAKIANFGTAFLSLGTFGAQGFVHWGLGSFLGLSVACGAFIGSHVAIRHADRVLTPVLLVITSLLLWKLVG